MRFQQAMQAFKEAYQRRDLDGKGGESNRRGDEECMVQQMQ